jgi:cytochrome b6-f complex iron-sulfur subunit
MNTSTEEETSPLPRSQFLKVAVGGMCMGYAGAIGYPIYRYLNSPVEKSVAMAAVKEVTLKDADKLPAGSALMFKFGAAPSLLIHHKDGTWVALNAVCTHLGCTVKFEPVEQKIVCACHGGVYDARTGDTVSGPPPKPLTRYEAKVSPGSVLITRA